MPAAVPDPVTLSPATATKKKVVRVDLPLTRLKQVVRRDKAVAAMKTRPAFWTLLGRSIELFIEDLVTEALVEGGRAGGGRGFIARGLRIKNRGEGSRRGRGTTRY